MWHGWPCPALPCPDLPRSPLLDHLVTQHGLTLRGNTFVEGLQLGPDQRITGLRCRGKGAASSEILEDMRGWWCLVVSAAGVAVDLDAVVLALGAGGLRAVLRGSPQLAKVCPNLSSAGALGGVDVMSARIWFDRTVPTETPANVFSRLRGAGGTFFMLDQLQPDAEALWGDEEPQGSVVACDFYNAGALLPLSDEAGAVNGPRLGEIMRLLTEELLPAAVPDFGQAKVVDSHVMRFPAAVSWFSPGSYERRPTLETPVKNLVCAGDWVRMGDREHGAKGLCQERALVSGLEVPGHSMGSA
eukprot:Skav205053  [mRNA]  locus=scaffold142:119391:125910:+ [translate_table: standard]